MKICVGTLGTFSTYQVPLAEPCRRGGTGACVPGANILGTPKSPWNIFTHDFKVGGR